MMKPKILFTESALPFILQMFGKEINKDGFIVESNSNELVLTTQGETIKANELGGITKRGFYKNDLHSIMELVENN